MDIKQIFDARNEIGEDKDGNRIYVNVSCEMVDFLLQELGAWRVKFHERCEVQLDEFRKAGMTEAAERCAEIADEAAEYFHPISQTGWTAANGVSSGIRKEFNLPKAG